jgi:hypothetical protein
LETKIVSLAGIEYTLDTNPWAYALQVIFKEKEVEKQMQQA